MLAIRRLVRTTARVPIPIRSRRTELGDCPSRGSYLSGWTWRPAPAARLARCGRGPSGPAAVTVEERSEAWPPRAASARRPRRAAVMRLLAPSAGASAGLLAACGGLHVVWGPTAWHGGRDDRLRPAGAGAPWRFGGARRGAPGSRPRARRLRWRCDSTGDQL